jgi:p-aminobenzoyl-glutamate transporter AbgT
MVDKILLMFVAGVLLAFIRWAVVGIVRAIRGKDV